MESFISRDGTRLAYHVRGDGPPLLCLPGGPAASAYLGDLGGLSRHRQLIMLDLRGTGQSAMPGDIASCRCDRLVDDVEALREHLGLNQMELLAHCAGANLATLYAGRHATRVTKLALITPSVRAAGITISRELRRETALLRRHERWFNAAFAALETIGTQQASAASWRAIAPFSYGRWDQAAQAHNDALEEHQNPEVIAAFGAEGAFEPEVTRAALTRFASPVQLLAGEVDLVAPPRTVAEFAGLFPGSRMVVQPGAGHFPWLDDAARFVAHVTTFLG